VTHVGDSQLSGEALSLGGQWRACSAVQDELKASRGTELDSSGSLLLGRHRWQREGVLPAATVTLELPARLRRWCLLAGLVLDVLLGTAGGICHTWNAWHGILLLLLSRLWCKGDDLASNGGLRRGDRFASQQHCAMGD